MTKTTKKTNSHQGDNGHTLFKYTGRVQLIGHSGRQSRTWQTITQKYTKATQETTE